jgi:hypothetical protein
MIPTLLLFFGLGVAGVSMSQTIAPAPEARLLGIVDFGSERTKDVVTAPDAVRVNEDFKVTITTFGGGYERMGETSVVITATGASVMVYDFTEATHPGVVCIAVIKRLPHTVTLRFEKPGEAVIRVWGRRVGPETPPLGVPTVLEHPITIK